MQEPSEYLLEAERLPVAGTPVRKPIRTGRVLVVDDDDDVRVTLSAVLGIEGHEVTGVRDGRAALEALERQDFDVLVVDLRLGSDPDGLAVLEEAVRARPELIGIVLTGYATLESAVQAMEAGALSYLLKPCNLDQMKAAVLRGLERCALAESAQQLQRAAAQAAEDRAQAHVRDAEARQEQAQAAAVRSAARVQHLQQITTHLGRYLETEALLQQIVRAAAQLLESPMAGVYLVDEAGEDLHLAAGEGIDVKRFGHIPRHQSAAGQAIARKTTLAVNDAHAASDTVRPALAGGSHAGSIVVAPIWDGETPMGVIEVYTPEPHEWATDEVDVMSALAAAAGVALINARLHEAVQVANRTRDEILATVTHDLKTPLTTISGTAQLLHRWSDASTTDSSSRMSTGLKTIHAMAGKMAGLIDELSDTVQLQSGDPVRLDLASVDIAGLVREAIEALKETAPRHSFVMHGPQSLTGRWDHRRLERIISNLLSNAVKYSPDGGPVIVRLRREADAAVLSVEDFGIGIPRRDRSVLFTPYARGTNVGDISGTGVGLLSVKRICELHGGSISVRSREGQGSTFTLCLPRTPPGPN